MFLPYQCFFKTKYAEIVILGEQFDFEKINSFDFLLVVFFSA